MAEVLVLKAEKREKAGTGAARHLRKAGRIPAIVYGHKQEPVAIHLDEHDLEMELLHRHHLLSVELEGKKDQFLIKDVQHDYLGRKLVHIDLVRVDLNERVTVTVALELKGDPKGLAEGGILDQQLVDIEIECLATQIPEVVRVNIANLGLGETFTAGEVQLPSGAELVTDADGVICVIHAKSEAEEVEGVEGAEGAESAEPEVIVREKGEDSEE